MVGVVDACSLPREGSVVSYFISLIVSSPLSCRCDLFRVCLSLVVSFGVISPFVSIFLIIIRITFRLSYEMHPVLTTGV